LDKWEKRARARKLAREKELRRRLLLLCLCFAAAAIILSLISVNLVKSSTSAVKTAAAGTASAGFGAVTADQSGNSSADISGSTADWTSGTLEGTTSASGNSGTDSAADSGAISPNVGEIPVATPTEAPLVEAELATPTPTPTPITEEVRQGFAVDPNNTNWNYNDNGVKTVYLTFDDGPSQYTSQVLDILERYSAKATFFETAQNPEYFSMIKECYDRGHTIGLHSYCHDYQTVYTSSDAFFSDLDEIGQIVQQQIGYVPCFIRFPGGSSNEVSKHYCEGIMTELSQEVQEKGYQYWDWNASSGDGSDETAEQTVANATQYAYLTNVVLLMHDAVGKQSTIDALPQVIEFYQGQGYTFKALDRSSMVVHHEIFN
jgi:peptidoglycan/xylan/chitin deacetylase (PgdA/CDA1 family)